MFEKLRAFADIGRTQGITTTATISIAGALTSTAAVEWYHIVYFTVLAIFAHMALNTYIALGDVELDAHTYVPSRNPVSSGLLSKKEALGFVYGGTIVCAALILFLVLYTDYISVSMAFLCFIPSYVWLLWYGWKGKRYLISYDLSFSVSYGFNVLFGVFAVGGMPTIYTWIFIGIVVFAATAFAQWENGLKDVDADRSVGVRSFAVVTQVKNNMKLHLSHPYFIYGVFLKIGFIICCIFAFLYFNNIYYLLFILLYGIPSQIFIMYRFLTKEKAIDHRKTILLDVTFAAILGYSVIIEKTGVLPIALLIVYLVGGYMVGSMFQYNSEFKFGRFSLSK
ncbi:MAG: UbiA prenyltransferase family protein [Thermoplasmatales archaeon]|nr:UbiA prenyltransferase family protein [Thermoplasmatales archaeon]